MYRDLFGYAQSYSYLHVSEFTCNLLDDLMVACRGCILVKYKAQIEEEIVSLVQFRVFNEHWQAHNFVVVGVQRHKSSTELRFRNDVL